jgi:para-nitrobenzyl esterase
MARFVPTYAYEFNDENAPPPPSPPVSFPYGAEHSAELQHLFNLTRGRPLAVPETYSRAAVGR